MIRIELSFATPAEAAEAMNRLAGLTVAPSPTPADISMLRAHQVALLNSRISAAPAALSLPAEVVEAALAGPATVPLGNAAPATLGTAEPAKRKRRTKAEMEAARAAEAAGGAPAGEDDSEPEDETTEAAAETPLVAQEPAAQMMPPLSEPAPSATASAPAAETPKSAGAALAELATDEGELALSDEDAATLRRTCVRPALQAIIDKSNNDVARAFLNGYGWKAISEIPKGRIQPFSDAAVAHAATL